MTKKLKAITNYGEWIWWVECYVFSIFSTHHGL